MTEFAQEKVGCLESCIAKPYIEKRLQFHRDQVEARFKQAQSVEELRKQSWHESDGAYEDTFGEVSTAEFNRDVELRRIGAEVLKCQAEAQSCEGTWCVLAELYMNGTIDQDLMIRNETGF